MWGMAFSYDESLMFKHNQRVFIDFVLASSHNDHVARHMNTDHGWAVASKYERRRLCKFIEI